MISSRISLRRPPPEGSSSSRYSPSPLLPCCAFRPRKEGPLMWPPLPDSLRTTSFRPPSSRKIAGSPRCGSAAGATSSTAVAAARATLLPPTSGDGSCALAMAAARASSDAPRRSVMRRSILVPHIPQNFMPGSLTCPQPSHFVLMPDLSFLRSNWRRSSRTPQLPQNLYSGRFSVPQKVQSMRPITPLSATLAHTCPKQQLSYLIRMMPEANRLQADFLPSHLATEKKTRALVLS